MAQWDCYFKHRIPWLRLNLITISLFHTARNGIWYNGGTRMTPAWRTVKRGVSLFKIFVHNFNWFFCGELGSKPDSFFFCLYLPASTSTQVSPILLIVAHWCRMNWKIWPRFLTMTVSPTRSFEFSPSPTTLSPEFKSESCPSVCESCEGWWWLPRLPSLLELESLRFFWFFWCPTFLLWLGLMWFRAVPRYFQFLEPWTIAPTTVPSDGCTFPNHHPHSPVRHTLPSVYRYYFSIPSGSNGDSQDYPLVSTSNQIWASL